jgi:hypothetical protein
MQSLLALLVIDMRTAIDDLPSSESVSRLRASGRIGRDTEATAVVIGDEVFTVPVVHRRFGNGGDWAFYLCSCGRRCRVLRLFEGSLECRWCLTARGLRGRVELIATCERAGYLGPKLIARLNSSSAARLHPRGGEKLDRRSRLEGKLRRSLAVARRHALEEHDKVLARLERK